MSSSYAQPSDQVSIRIKGEPYTLTRDQVLAALPGKVREPLHHWAVEIDGQTWPVKQVFEAAIDVHRQEFNTTTARTALGQLGFRIVEVVPGAESASTEPALPAERPYAQLAASLAVTLLKDRPGVEVAEVIAAADALEDWLMGRSAA